MGESNQSLDLSATVENGTNTDVNDYSNNINKTGILKENSIFIFLAVIFLFGLLLGSLFIAKADKSVLDTLDYLFFSSIQTRTSGGLFQVFIASVTSSFIFILFSFFFGLSMWGSAIEPLVAILRGFGLGMTSGYVYAFGVSGFFYNLLVILPGAFVSILAILLAGEEGFRFSKRLNHAHRMKSDPHSFSPQPSVKNYCIRFALITILAMIGALLDVVTAFLFSGIFQNLA